VYGYYRYLNEARERERPRERKAEVQRAISREARRVLRRQAQLRGVQQQARA
jgi:hypothetical protein